MDARRVARLTSYLLLVACIASGFSWLVARGYGEQGAATLFMVIAFVSLVISGTILRLLRALPSAREEDWRRRHVVEHHGPPGRQRAPLSSRLAGGDAPVAPVEDPVHEMARGMRGFDLPPPSNWTTVGEEVRHYPTLEGTDMSVEEYDLWTEDFGPLEGQWAENEERERQRRDRRGQDLEPRW